MHLREKAAKPHKVKNPSHRVELKRPNDEKQLPVIDLSIGNALGVSLRRSYAAIVMKNCLRPKESTLPPAQ